MLDAVPISSAGMDGIFDMDVSRESGFIGGRLDLSYTDKGAKPEDFKE